MAFEAEDSVEDPEFKPLTAEEARRWRQNQPVVSPWRIVMWQGLAGVVIALLAGAWGGSATALSVAYGAFAVVFPAALMVRGLHRQRAVVQGHAVMLGFVVWELVKIVLTVALLLAAPTVVSSLSWLALVLGFVVAMKVYWVAAWLYARRVPRRRTN